MKVSDYAGGIALWGAVPAIYDTTRLPLDRGIHVHARMVSGGDKHIDETYRGLTLVRDERGRDDIVVSELDAIYWMVTSAFGYRMKTIACTRCGYSHLDRDWFSVNPHRKHLCAGCGRPFSDNELSVGNPLCSVRELLQSKATSTKVSKRKLRLTQADYPGGIQIWGSNPAIVWTSPQAEEEGIHVHAFVDEGPPTIDDTFGSVEVDGVALDPMMVRVLMAQTVLPHLVGRVTFLACSECNEPHFATSGRAHLPSSSHACEKCGSTFKSKGRLRNVIGNPLVAVLARLASAAPRVPQVHTLGLIPETL